MKHLRRKACSLLCILALCLSLFPASALADAVVVVPPGGGDGGGSVVVTPDEPDNVTVIVPGEDGGDVVVVIPPDEEEEPEPPAIGDVVNFAGHEWYIIGTDDAADGGVTAPAGCYTLFAKNNDFGSTAFRTEENGGDRENSTANHYKDSDLQKAMNEIANGFSEADKANIVPRTLDNIAGDAVEEQFVWPIGMQDYEPSYPGAVRGEAALIEQSIRAFDTTYWTRTSYTMIDSNGHYGYHVFGINADGSSTFAGAGRSSYASYATETFAVRPAMYVKADAFTGGAKASPVIGNTVSFAGHEWYLIGTGLGGVTAPEGCYTLFAKNNDFGSTVFRAGADQFDNTANHYKDSDLQKAMEEIANSSLSAYQEDIVARATLDGISGDSPTDQLLWPLSKDEVKILDSSIQEFASDYYTRTVLYDYISPSQLSNMAFYYSCLEKEIKISVVFDSVARAIRPALYVKAEAVEVPEEAVPLTGGKVYFGNQDWYIVGMGDIGPVPGPSNTVTLFADSIVEGQYATTSINYSQGDLCAAMKNLGASLNLSAQAQSLISSRRLTTEDEITGDAVTTPFWPLSKSEFEAIQAENQSLLMGDAYPYWLRTEAPSELEIHRTVYAGDTDGSLTQNSTPNSNFGVRPAFYLNLSTLFFAAGESSMGSSVDGNPVKLMPPGTDSQKRWNFVMYDRENLYLSMSAEQGQSGQSLTFQYNGTGGTKHFLAYVLEQDGVPLYYGKAANLIDSGTGTVTVPLLGVGSKLEDGDYTMRFYVEDRTDGIYFASDTVDLTISVGNGAASITDMGEVTVHTHSFGTGWKSDESGHWHECSCGAKNAVEAHVYNNDQDSTCNICEYERQITPPVSQEYTVTFNANGGSVSPSSATTTDGKLESLPTPTYDGYDFIGWYTEETGGEEVTTNTVFAEDTTIYAHWQKQAAQEYTVTLNANGGTVNSGALTSYTHGVGATLPTDVTRSGYTFAGWYDNEALSGQAVTAISATDTGDKIYWAKWTTNTVTPSTPSVPVTPEPPADSEETVTNPDGSTTTTITKDDGSASTTTVTSDGKVEADVTLSEDAIADSGDAPVILPVQELPVTSDRDTAPTLTVHLPADSAKVDIPVQNVTAGTVAILVHEDGSEEVLKNTVQTENGISVTVNDGDTLKIVDNSKTFDDVSDDHWGAAAINFATSRELFAGTDENTFSPDSAMTRAMIWSVLARYEGADTAAADGSAWYAGSQQWAIDNGISDGTNPDDAMTREQFAAMLYRSVGSPAVSGSIDGYGDAASISDWASDAMIWAVQNGIIGGYEDGTLRGQNTATRTEVAAMLQRYVALGAK